ncbi:uncharacterized protein LOC105688609 isoform X2 [Athalia rosae]|uniref:uncharacterized protein LOC105688609 isoform X2 n=1 Tax=Athalia rosae TaxID=37344 RepID=UPI002034577C|nr:uncharacterized protein LOC105688609 isoform X2 [Athalia rosae]
MYCKCIQCSSRKIHAHCAMQANQDINESLQRSTPLHPVPVEVDLQHMRRTTPFFAEVAYLPTSQL